MKTMFSVQPVSDVGSQPLSSPPLSSPPAFNRITNLRGSQRCPNKNCTQKGSIPSVKRKTISTKTDLGRWLCSQTGQLLIGAPWCCNSCFQAKFARNGISSRQSSKVQQPQPVQQVPQHHSQVQLQLQARAALLRSCSRTSRPVDLRSVPLRRARGKGLMTS